MTFDIHLTLRDCQRSLLSHLVTVCSWKPSFPHNLISIGIGRISIRIDLILIRIDLHALFASTMLIEAGKLYPRSTSSSAFTSPRDTNGSTLCYQAHRLKQAHLLLPRTSELPQ